MKFRKKPVIIEAIQFNGLNYNEVMAFCHPLLIKTGHNYLTIPTLEGNFQACISDWIIKGIVGECYPCKNHIFEATYEKVD